ncbi:hypothetical protein Tco_0271420 [Tanacetum coccineum]
MSSDKRSSFILSFILSSHLSFGLPFILNPSTTKASTLLTGVDCGLLLTCLNHLNRHSLILLMIVSTSSSALYTPLGTMSSIVLPQVHLSILNSATSILLARAFVIGQHTDPYNIEGLIATLQNFPLSLRGTFLSRRNHVAAIHFSHAALIWWDTSSSTLSDLCVIDPRYLKDSLGCKILSPLQISTYSLWAISTLPKSHLRYSVFSRPTLMPLSSSASL